MTIRVAVIGAGTMGAEHARIVTEDLSGATLTVVCDASSERAKTVANQYDIPDFATDPLEVVARKDVDAVLIASPDETHCQLCIAAIEASKPVLCEKPLATNAADCLKIIEAEVQHGSRVIQVGYMRRYDPSYGEMKEVLRTGQIGAPVLFHGIHRNVEAPPSFTGQMAISNSATHDFDIVRFLIESEFVSIQSFQPASKGADKAGAAVFLVLQMETGQFVSIEVNNNAGYGYDVRGELVGEKGTVELFRQVNARTNAKLKSTVDYSADWQFRFAEAYRKQSKDWILSIENNVPSAIGASAWDGYCAAVVGEAGVQSLEHDRRVDVAIIEKPTLYV